MKLYRSPRLVLLAACIVAAVVGAIVAAERSAGAMAGAANAFLDSLSPEQRKQAVFEFDTDERYHWNFIPTETFPRNGLTLRDMTERQRERAKGLLSAGLSQRGYLTATQIIELETILGEIEERTRREGRRALNRDPEWYFFSVFGTPSAEQTWGWRVEGHHVSLHFTVANGQFVASSPMFFGSNPAEVREGPQKGLRILGDQEDAARALLMALDTDQRAKAVFRDTPPRDILTGSEVDIEPLSPVGIKAAEMTPDQRDLLMALIEVYTSKVADDIAAERMAKIRDAGIENVAFAWAGEAERGKRHYYRIQGPTFLVEHDNTQNDGNHVHSVWRDFDGDFGRDLLREHLRSVAH